MNVDTAFANLIQALLDSIDRFLTLIPHAINAFLSVFSG